MTTPVTSAAPSRSNPFIFDDEDEKRLPEVRGMKALVEELGLDEFSSLPPADRIFAPAKGHALGLCFHRASYEPSDSYIDQHEIRKAASQNEARENPSAQLKWQESVGLLDLGGGIGGAFPLATFDGAYIAAYFGFYASTLVRYRRLELQRDGKPVKKVGIPFSAQRALAMPAGTEFEITGQGRLNASAGGIVGGGFALGPFIAGVAGISTVSHGLLKEYSITVTAIDGNGKVRVVLRELKDMTVSSSASVMAGLIGPGYDGVNLNQEGTLVAMPGNSTAIGAVDNLLDRTSAKLESSISGLHRSVLLAAVDLDLKNEKAREIYQELLLLSPRNAKHVAKKRNSGVELLTIKENQNEIGFSNAVNFFGDRLLSSERTSSDVVGKMVRRDGSDFCYRNSIYEKKFHNFLTGSKSVRWEGVTMGDGHNSRASRYFHLKYERDNIDFEGTKLTRFLKFAEVMGVSLESFSRTEGSDLEKLKKLWLRAAHVETNIDVYFTTEGVSKIENAEKEDAIVAFFLAALAIDPSLIGFPADNGVINPKVESLLKEYKELSEPRQLFGFGRFRERIEIRKEYSLLTGRSLERDLKLYLEAQDFGDAIDMLQNVRDRDLASQFFQGLGRSRGFQFMTTIGALKLLAGQENTRVGDLSIAGLRHGLVYAGSAQIEGPHETIYRELTKMP